MNSSSFEHSVLTTQPMAPLWIILLIAAIFGVILIWKEVQRKQGLLLWRILAQGLVLAGLLGLSLRPSFSVEKSTGPIVLLTKGYDKKIADSLLSKYPSSQLIRTFDAEDFPSAAILSSYADLLSGRTIGFV